MIRECEPAARVGAAPLLALFTDFGVDGPYCGQVHAVWAALAPEIPRVDLFNAAPAYDVEAGAHLLYAYTRHLPPGAVVEAVVDPGVGGPRDVLAVRADGVWFAAPDNGLLAVVVHRAATVAAWRVIWRPETMSATFHGRDVFAPVAACLARYGAPPLAAEPLAADAMAAAGIADPAERVILVDPYGNLVTGIPADAAPPTAKILIGGTILRFARRFGEVAAEHPFWYVNANGLVEIAVNCGSAAATFAAGRGTPVELRL